MSARPSRQSPSDVDRLRVRLSDPGEVAAAVPQLLGFRPWESVVMIGLGGRTGNRVGLTARADIPPADVAGALAGDLVRRIRSDFPTAVVVAIVSEAPDEGAGPPGVSRPEAGLPHRALLGELTAALTAVALPLREALLVRSGRWWSYECPHPCCAPGGGTPLPGGVSALEAASVVSGTVVENSRADLERRLDHPAGRAAAREACLRWTRNSSAEDAWTAIDEALAACRSGAPSGRRLTDDLLARVVWGLRDTAVRDRALALALIAEPSALEELWTECTRRAPAPLDAAPATLLAVSAWLRGDGAMANVALDRALDSDPGHRLARLLAEALAACVNPTDLRALIAGSTGPSW